MKTFAFTIFNVVCLLWAFSMPALAIDKGTQKPPDTADLKPNEYTWNPDASPTGAVGIIVDLTNQMIYVYRGGKLIGRSTISTGIKSHPTAPGTYTILTKNLTYHSEKYHEASMPYMERLTWDGMAIHGGNNPGKPSSHGCVHVPLDFAKKLYGITNKGDTVLISDLKEAPGDTVNPGLVPQQTPQPPPNPKSNVKVPRGGPPPTNVSPNATPIPTSTPNPSPSPSGSPASTASSIPPIDIIHAGTTYLGSGDSRKPERKTVNRWSLSFSLEKTTRTVQTFRPFTQSKSCTIRVALMSMTKKTLRRHCSDGKNVLLSGFTAILHQRFS